MASDLGLPRACSTVHLMSVASGKVRETEPYGQGGFLRTGDLPQHKTFEQQDLSQVYGLRPETQNSSFEDRTMAQVLFKAFKAHLFVY